MASCREVTHLVSEGLDRDLAFGERVAMRLHFAICRGCRNFEDQVLRLRAAVKALSRDEDERTA
ncbi:MAG: zf-HC2 domain-containing protein [Burkholderiales bacterium]|nr:zf-HC2 domain-containing protein [Burkholderiales bacterium]